MRVEQDAGNLAIFDRPIAQWATIDEAEDLCWLVERCPGWPDRLFGPTTREIRDALLSERRLACTKLVERLVASATYRHADAAAGMFAVSEGLRTDPDAAP
jgi:hypothetical protein